MSVPGRRSVYAVVAGVVALVGAAASTSLVFSSPSSNSAPRVARNVPEATRPSLGQTTMPSVPTPAPNRNACTVSGVRTPEFQRSTGLNVPPRQDGWQMAGIVADPGLAFPKGFDPHQSSSYELAQLPGSDSGPYLMLRIDLLSGAERAGPALPSGATQLVVADGYLWAGWATSDNSDQASPAILCQFDLATMALVRRINIPDLAPGASVVIAPGEGGEVMVGDGKTLMSIASSSGAWRVVASDLAGSVAFASVSPEADVVYVTMHPFQGGTQEVDEIDLASGTVVARNTDLAIQGPGPGSVTAVDQGVWLSWRTGMFGSTALLAKFGLSLQPSPTDPSPVDKEGPNDLFRSIMGGRTILADGVLWIAAGDGQVGCLDPATGAVRSEYAFPRAGDGLIGVGNTGTLYFDYQSGASEPGSSLLAATPPGACFG